MKNTHKGGLQSKMTGPCQAIQRKSRNLHLLTWRTTDGTIAWVAVEKLDPRGAVTRDPPNPSLTKCQLSKGVISTKITFDGSRNAHCRFGGSTTRYMLSHPNQCQHLALPLPKGITSTCHSAVDWSDPDSQTYPEFQLARRNEWIFHQAVGVPYLPTNWVGYIFSLSFNFQCNTRFCIESTYISPIREYGF
jgi:hypothetical protein